MTPSFGRKCQLKILRCMLHLHPYMISHGGQLHKISSLAEQIHAMACIPKLFCLTLDVSLLAPYYYQRIQDIICTRLRFEVYSFRRILDLIQTIAAKLPPPLHGKFYLFCLLVFFNPSLRTMSGYLNINDLSNIRRHL